MLKVITDKYNHTTEFWLIPDISAICCIMFDILSGLRTISFVTNSIVVDLTINAVKGMVRFKSSFLPNTNTEAAIIQTNDITIITITTVPGIGMNNPSIRCVYITRIPFSRKPKRFEPGGTYPTPRISTGTAIYPKMESGTS